MKKILALALALIMVLGLATTVSAETISTDSNDNHSYAVYQIFKGTVEKDAQGNEKLVEVTRGKNSSLANEDGVAAALAALEAANGTDQEKLDVILNYVDLESAPYGTVTKDAPLTTAEPGYYLLKDQGPIGENESYSLYIVKVVKDVEISPKRGTIVPSKKVDDVNDSISADDEQNGALAEQPNRDSADYDIGDSVPFTLTATLPEYYESYEIYKLVFHDKADAGLTFQPGTVKVYLNSAEPKNLIDASKYTLRTATTDGCTFELEFTNLRTAVPAAGDEDKIIIKFDAILNNQAVVGSAGNANEMKLQYSNDPNWVPDPQNPDGPPPTGETPTDKVVVFTYKVLVNKVDNNRQPLNGATFELFKWDLTVEGEDKWESLGPITQEAGSQFVWNGVDDGKYKLVEVDAPAGYNKAEDIIFEITAEHDLVEADPHLKTLTGSNGFTGDAATGTLTASIQNNPGAVLPGTGGVGTTIFYIVGGLLVAAAVVLLVTKKRMATAE